MNKRYFQLQYVPKTNEYVVSAINRRGTIDLSKLDARVKKFNNYTWVCSNKTSLLEYAETMKIDRIKRQKKRLDILESAAIREEI